MHRMPWLGWSSLLVAFLGSSCDDIELRNRRPTKEADGGGYEEATDASMRDAEPDTADATTPAPDGGTGDASTPGSANSTNPDPTKPTDPKDLKPTNPGSDAGTPQQTVSTDTYAITSRGRLVQFERATGTIARSASIRGLLAGERILGGDIRPANAKLYALTDGARLYEIDLENGSASLAATLTADANDMSAPFEALRGKQFGVDFNPVADRLRVVSDAGENLRIDVVTGSTTTDGTINPAPRQLTAAAYTQSFATACRTRLLVIDSAARRLLLQDPPNAGAVSDIGSLGESLGDVTSFEIQTAMDGSDRGFIAVAQSEGIRLLDIDLRTGAVSNSRALPLDSGETVVALSAAPPSAPPPQTTGELLGLTAGQRLISFNRGAPGKLCSSANLTGLASGDALLGFDVRPSDGKVYALASSGKLYTIAVPSGEASLTATLAADSGDTTDPFTALRGSEFGVGFNPVADRLRVISDAGQNLRINVSTGATTTDTALTGGSTGAGALAYTNAFASTKATTLFALDRSQMALIRVGGDPATTGACSPMPDTNNPNCGSTQAIGGLGLATGTHIGGFEIDGKAATAFAALTVPPAMTSTLYAIDLVSGKATLPTGVANATIGGGEPVQSLTLAAAPIARAFGLTSDGKLLTFSLAAPSTPTATARITGLQGTERLLGIDVRPLDGKLYALGNSGRLYTLDPATGAASLVATLAAANGDDVPFTGFTTKAHGVDFNPAADLLRVVDADAQNLRIVPSARNDLKPGDVLSDALLNPGAPSIVAAAYTDSYANSPWTTLYAIDSQVDTLYLQGGTQGTPTPNWGTLTAIGALGVDAMGDVGFDIAGGHNGLAVAAVQTSGTRSTLYGVNLSAGTLTPFNPQNNEIGPEGVGPLVGLAVELK